jgi:stringent starvation protein B
MSELSTKPYIIRAIYEWCADATLTPYITVRVDQHVRVPMEYVKNGEITLSVSLQATRNLTIGNDLIQFSARFNGVSREISIPIYAVQAIFSRENGQGFFFESEATPAEFANSLATPSPPLAPTPARVTLQAVPDKATITEISDVSHIDTPQAPADSDAPDDPDKPRGAPPRGNLRIIK